MVTLKSQKSRKDINLTQISQIPQIFSGSPLAQNLKKILMKILLTKNLKTLSTWLRLRL